MKLIFDIETTGAQRNRGHPFDYRNKICNVGFKDIDTGEIYVYKIEYDEDPYGEHLRTIQKLLDECTCLIGFNSKFDCHWLRRYGLRINDNCRIFDCQLVWFILTFQQFMYPSLDKVAEWYGLSKKFDKVKIEYWEKGLDTNQVPYDILLEYLIQDLNVTEQVYLKVQEELEKQTFEMKRLTSVSLQDLKVLEDIEWNGLLFNKNKSITKGNQIQREIEEIDKTIREIFKVDWLNINSGDHLSVILYGGTIDIDSKEQYIFTYKDGRQAEKTRNIKLPFTFKGIFKPLEGTTLAKAGFYSTKVDTLKVLNETARGEGKKILDMLLHRSRIEQQRSMYYHGFPNKASEMNWTDDIIHTNINQCVAVSGRTSSSSPNVQNLEKKVKEIIITRF